MTDETALKIRLNREIAARKAAEEILESKSLELFKANKKLKNLNTSLETEVEEGSKKLTESEKRFKILVESAHDLIYIVGNEGSITYVNNVCEKEFGYNVEEVWGTHYSQFIAPEHREKASDKLLSLIDEKRRTAYTEIPTFRKNGAKAWLGQNIKLTYFQDGSFKEAIVIARDITKKKKEEEQLISTQLQLISLIENMHEGVLFHSISGEIILINSFFCDFFGCFIPVNEIIGKHLNEIQHKFESQIIDFDQQLKNIVEEPKKQKIGLEVRLVDNRTIKYDYIPIVSNKKVIGTLWQFTDITNQKLLDIKIRNSEEKYRGIIENMELGLLEVDDKGVILKPYEWFCKMTGYEPDELVGKKAEDLFLPPEYKSIVDKHHDIREDEEQSVYEIEIFKKNGQRIWVIISGAPFYDLEGNKKGSIGIHFDITDQKRLQDEPISAKEVAEKAQIAEQKFLANMSHEIRTPLNAVIGMSHLLNDTPLNNEQKEYIDMMQYSANLLRKLVTDVLDFSKIESGELEVTNAPFDLIGLLKTLHKTFELKVSNKPVNFKVSFPKLSHLLIGDETLLNQVLFNLLGNAEKFTSSGEINLIAKLKSKRGDKVGVLFEIRDTGIGIDKEKQNDIFKEFKQESRETSVKYGGTGLGLSITKQIIDVLGGRIWLESEKGKGTSFFVDLTLRYSQQSLEEKKVINQRAISSNSSVLVFEDNLVNQSYIKKILEKEKIHFEIASNGQEGFEISKKQQFDLIFMDISMPEMNGYEATIAMRNHSGPNQDTPIIALTASAMLNNKDKAFQAGMNDYMTKPFTPHELKSVLSKYLNSEATEESINSGIVTDETSLLNQETLAMFYQGDEEYAFDMFVLFLRQYDEQIELLRGLLKSNDYKGAKKIVHRMKPTFSMVGAPEIQEVFKILEDKLRFNDSIGITNLWKKSEALLEKYLPAINQEYNRLQKKSLK